MHLHQTDDQEAALESESLGQKIELIIRRLPPKNVSLSEIMDIVGEDSLILLTIFLSLVFLVPVSIPGLSTVFGAGILLIGITRLFDCRPWLPKAVAHRQLSSERLRDGLARALVWFHRVERISRPHRLPRLTSVGWVTRMNQLSFILAALLLMAPFGFVPFSNTLPALALILLAVGMLQRDGVSILLGNLANGVTIVYFAILLAAGGWSIYELLRFLG
ncbi:MAG TPA: exopolysaccharide biosynthesis protein [Thermoanaerobaculia bacterium]|nr:exopolysaccharide biosynthesis protein [Thermoanaerobaculia bacterium]